MVGGLFGVTAICETFKISCLMGKTPCERRCWIQFNEPIIPFGTNSRISPYLCERHIETTSIWFKSLARYIPRLRIIRGCNLERRQYGRRHWRIGGDGRIRTPRQKTQCKGSVNSSERWQFFVPNRWWISQRLWRRTTSENIHLDQGSSKTRRGTRSSSRRIRRTLFSNPSSRWLNTRWCGS